MGTTSFGQWQELMSAWDELQVRHAELSAAPGTPASVSDLLALEAEMDAQRKRIAEFLHAQGGRRQPVDRPVRLGLLRLPG